MARANRAEAWLTNEQRDLAAKWMGLVRKIVAEHSQDAGDRAELTSRLQLALLRAARTYDASRGYTFQAYATRILKNAVIDERRALGRRREVLGLPDWQIEHLANLDYQPANVSTSESADGDGQREEPQQRPVKPEETALQMLRDGATNREIQAKTGLTWWKLKHLAQSQRIERAPGRKSVISLQLLRTGLTDRKLAEAAEIRPQSARRLMRRLKKRLGILGSSHLANELQKKRPRRDYDTAAYILGKMGNPSAKTNRGRKQAIPESLWPELRQRQLDGATLAGLQAWLKSQGYEAGLGTVGRTMERIKFVTPPKPRREELAQIIEQLPPESDEEIEKDLRKQLKSDAYHGDDWKQRHSAARMLLDMIERKRKRAETPKPQQTVPAFELPTEDEEAAARAQLGKAN